MEVQLSNRDTHWAVLAFRCTFLCTEKLPVTSRIFRFFVFTGHSSNKIHILKASRIIQGLTLWRYFKGRWCKCLKRRGLPYFLTLSQSNVLQPVEFVHTPYPWRFAGHAPFVSEPSVNFNTALFRRCCISVAYRGGVWGVQPPPPKSRRHSKIVPNSTQL